MKNQEKQKSQVGNGTNIGTYYVGKDLRSKTKFYIGL